MSSLLSEDAWLAISSPNFSIQMDIGQPFANAMPVRVMITREEIGQWHVLSLDAIQYNSNCYFWMKTLFLTSETKLRGEVSLSTDPPFPQEKSEKGLLWLTYWSGCFIWLLYQVLSLNSFRHRILYAFLRKQYLKITPGYPFTFCSWSEIQEHVTTEVCALKVRQSLSN